MRYTVAIAGIVCCLGLALAGAPVRGLEGDSRDSSVFKDGDVIQVKFTCRDKDGLVASSTEKSVADDASIRKSEIFFPRGSDKPITAVAGQEKRKNIASGHGGFENEIIYRIAQMAVGKRPSELAHVTLKDEIFGKVPDEERFVTLALVRERKKEDRMRRNQYVDNFGTSPKVGDSFKVEYFKGVVSAVTDDDVTITYKVLDGNEVQTPFGKGVIVDKGDRYEVHLEPWVGKLVRSAGMVGRIIEVTNDHFVVDYGLPLAGETIDCDVDVRRANEATK